MFNQNPILLNFPDSFESERLLIRAPRLGDGLAIHEAVLESFENLNKWMPWAKTLPSFEETEKNLREGIANFTSRQELRLLLIRKEDSKLIGSSGMHNINWNIPKFEIGYWCRTGELKQGYISEAVRAISLFAFDALGAKRIEIRISNLNLESRKIPERLGFTLDGILRNNDINDQGQLIDKRVYSLIDKFELV